MAQKKTQVVTYKAGKLKFEIFTNPGTVLKFRDRDVIIGLDKVLSPYTVFYTKRGGIASREDLKKAFGTHNEEECCRIIVTNGDLQLSAAERKEQIDKKTRQIVHYIHTNWVDPSTNLPHSANLLLGEFKQAKVKVDVNSDTRKQAENAVNKMKGNKMQFTKAVALTARISIMDKDVGKCTNIIKKYDQHSRGRITADGGRYQKTFTVELSRSDTTSLTNELDKATKNNYGIDFANDSDQKSNGANGGSEHGGKIKKGKNAREGKGKEQKHKQRQKKVEKNKAKAMQGVDKSEEKKKDKKKK